MKGEKLLNVKEKEFNQLTIYFACKSYIYFLKEKNYEQIRTTH